MKRKITVVMAAVVAVGLLTAGQAAGVIPGAAGSWGQSGGAGCVLPVFGPGAGYQPTIHPSDFGPDVTNPYFPLTPGRTYVYVGVKDGLRAVNVFAPSKTTEVIDGVETRTVNDRLYLNGVLEERTTDYYAQDRCGNVWYFGEDTATLDSSGHVVSTAGSFHAGLRGAQAGVYMQARPQIGRLFRQEWSPGNAEDQFKAVSQNGCISVPYDRFGHALRTSETTDLEPDVVDNKFYVKGLGQVEEVAVKGPVEKLVLVDVLS